MPHKLNEGHQHKIPRQKFKVPNWASTMKVFVSAVI